MRKKLKIEKRLQKGKNNQLARLESPDPAGGVSEGKAEVSEL